MPTDTARLSGGLPRFSRPTSRPASNGAPSSTFAREKQYLSALRRSIAFSLALTDLSKTTSNVLQQTADPDTIHPTSLAILDQMGSQGVMFEPPSLQDFQTPRKSVPEQRALHQKIQPSPLTQEYEQRILQPKAKPPRSLPPGCPPGGKRLRDGDG